MGTFGTLTRIFIVISFVISVVTVQAAMVNSPGDQHDFYPGDGVCDICGDPDELNNPYCGICTFRAALEEADSTGDPDVIVFSGAMTIQPDSPLAADTPVTIDGGNVVTIDGSMLTSGSAGGLTLSGGNSVVRGITVQNFEDYGIGFSESGNNTVENCTLAQNGNGITISSSSPNNTIKSNIIIQNSMKGIRINSDGNVVKANKIGTDGNQAFGNGDGVYIFGSNNTVGDPNGVISSEGCAGDCNLISGNTADGVEIGGDGNTVRGNFIGVKADGLNAMGNADNGINIAGGQTNLIADNIISGNDGHGIRLEDGASENKMRGNYIGANLYGQGVLGNEKNGIDLSGANKNTIGFDNPVSIPVSCQGDCNLIVGNDLGISIVQALTGENKIIGNYIGVASDGWNTFGNLGHGIYVNGFTTDITGNLIGGNQGDGIHIYGVYYGGEGINNNHVIYGNKIGVGSGEFDVGNKGRGVYIDWSSGNRVGGENAGQGNVIGNNGKQTGGAGVVIADTRNILSKPVGNRILGNSIFSNGQQGQIGIDLNDDGFTANDASDSDQGPNNLQNFPVLTKIEEDVLFGELASIPNSSFRLEFFETIDCDDHGRGQGKTLLKILQVTTDNSGNASFETNVETPLQGYPLTATATAPDGSTSEFSPCFLPAVLTLSEDDGNPPACNPLKKLNGQVIAQIKLTANEVDNWLVQQITFDTFGSGNESTDILEARLYAGVQNFTLVDKKDGISADDGKITFNVNQTVPANNSLRLLLQYDFNPGIGLGNGNSYRVRVNSDGVTASPEMVPSYEKLPSPPEAFESGRAVFNDFVLTGNDVELKGDIVESTGDNYTVRVEKKDANVQVTANIFNHGCEVYDLLVRLRLFYWSETDQGQPGPEKEKTIQTINTDISADSTQLATFNWNVTKFVLDNLKNLVAELDENELKSVVHCRLEISVDPYQYNYDPNPQNNMAEKEFTLEIIPDVQIKEVVPIQVIKDVPMVKKKPMAVRVYARLSDDHLRETPDIYDEREGVFAEAKEVGIRVTFSDGNPEGYLKGRLIRARTYGAKLPFFITPPSNPFIRNYYTFVISEHPRLIEDFKEISKLRPLHETLFLNGYDAYNLDRDPQGVGFLPRSTTSLTVTATLDGIDASETSHNNEYSTTTEIVTPIRDSFKLYYRPIDSYTTTHQNSVNDHILLAKCHSAFLEAIFPVIDVHIGFHYAFNQTDKTRPPEDAPTYPTILGNLNIFLFGNANYVINGVDNTVSIVPRNSVGAGKRGMAITGARGVVVDEYSDMAPHAWGSIHLTAHEVSHTYTLSAGNTLEDYDKDYNALYTAPMGYDVEHIATDFLFTRPNPTYKAGYAKISLSPDKLIFRYNNFSHMGNHQIFNTWITKENYLILLKKLTDYNSGSKSEKQMTENFILIKGTIDKGQNTGSVGTCFVHQSPSDPASDQGEFFIGCLSSDDQVLSSTLFNSPKWTEYFEPENDQVFDFSISIAYPNGTKKIVLKKGDTILAQKEVSLNPPVLTQPVVSKIDENTYRLQWRATDDDNDPLKFMLGISSDNQTWLPLPDQIMQNGDLFTSDFNSELVPGGENLVIRVIASDGINTAESKSEKFSMPDKFPSAQIVSPANSSVYKSGSKIIFNGLGYDPEDGFLDKNNLLWTSSLDGVIGNGETITADSLSSGDHEIKLAVSDSKGNQAETTVSLTVGKAPVVINEIYPSLNGQMDEYVEIYNPGENPVSLAGWEIGNGDGKLEYVISGDDTDWDGVLGPYSFLVIHISGDSDTVSEDLYLGLDQGILNAEGDSVTLIDQSGEAMDFVRFGTSSHPVSEGTGWTGENPLAPAGGQSLGRDKFGTDTDMGADWESTGGVDTDTPTPGMQNLSGLQTHELTVEIIPPSGGSVTGQNIDCPADCSANFIQGDSVTLQAIAATGFSFLGWADTLNGDQNPADVIIDQDKHMIAYFGSDTGDTDSDGAPDTMECGPNGTDPSYDGNNNGKADYQESGTTSLRTSMGNAYATLAISGAVQQSLNNVQATGNPSPGDSPEGLQFPYGFFSMNINNLNNSGDCETVEIFLPRNTDIDTYFKFGPTPDNPLPHWYEFMFDGMVGAEIFHEDKRTRIVLHLCDGRGGDADLAPDGKVEDPGGAAYRGAVPIPAYTRWGILLLVVMLALGATIYLSKVIVQSS